jgi:ParB/RepB/Spo0J family partition protein
MNRDLSCGKGLCRRAGTGVGCQPGERNGSPLSERGFQNEDWGVRETLATRRSRNAFAPPRRFLRAAQGILVSPVLGVTLRRQRIANASTCFGEVIMTTPKNEKRKKLNRHWDDDVCWRTTRVILPKAPEKVASGSPSSVQFAIVERAGTDDIGGEQLAPVVGEGPGEVADDSGSSPNKEIVADPNSAILPEPRLLQLKHSFPELQMISLADIDEAVVGRKIDREHVAVLARSLQAIDQTTPISVHRKSNGRWGILDGGHRFQAAVGLGVPEIGAQVFDRADLELRQVQISQNLHRKGLTALEQALSDAEWVETVRQKATQVADPIGGRQPSEKGYSKAAREAGLTPERMGRSSLISTISADVQALIREHGLDDNQSALIKIAKADKAVQHQKVFEIAQRQPRRSRKVEPRNAPEPGTPAPPAAGTNETEFPIEPDRSEMKSGKVADEQTLISGASLSAPDLSPQSGLGTTSPLALSAPAFSDYPALPDQLKRADVGAAKEMLTAEWRNCRLRRVLEAAPNRAGKSFFYEEFLPDFYNITGGKPGNEPKW